MRHYARMVVFVAIWFLSVTGMALGQDGSSVPRITCEELKTEIGTQSVTVLDVRTEGDWTNSPLKISGAVHEQAASAASWMSKYGKDQKLILYCA